MIVNSATLTKAAQHLRSVEVPFGILKNGVYISPGQAETAARLLREAKRSVITSPGVIAGSEERPGYIEPEHQEGKEVLVFQVGIIPSTIYRIARDGGILDEAAAA